MRTFVAIELDDELKRPLAALQARLKPHCPALRWVDTEKIHLTLKFIGEIADDLCAAFTEIEDLLGDHESRWG